MPVILTAPKAVRGDPNNRLTTCKVCHLGVFKTESWQWSQQPLGIIHTLCTKGET